MELISLPAGSGRIRIEIPAEWVRRSFLEGGEKLTSLIEAIKEMERFDFKHVVYPELVKKREHEKLLREYIPAVRPPEPQHVHIPATLRKKSIERGAKPYCIACLELLTP